MRFDLWLADACRTADVPYDDFILTIATGGYPCLPGAVPGSPRTFDETDLLTLYVYGRLLAFGFDVMRAGEYAGRVHCALRANAAATSIAIVLTPHEGKRVVVEREKCALSPSPARPEKIEFNIAAIQKFLNRRLERHSEEQNCKAQPETHSCP